MPVAVVVTCKGRLAHLQATAPLILGTGLVGYVLVDWGCPQGSGAWLSRAFPGTLIIRTESTGFEKTKAANLGAKAAIQAGYDTLLFLDADTVVHPPVLRWFVANARPDRFQYIKAKDPRGEIRKSLTGILQVPAAAFAQVGGFDTTFGQTYGNEDVELRLRLWRLAGLGFETVPEPLVESGAIAAIEHGDELRTAWYPDKDLERNQQRTLEHLVKKYSSYTGGANLGLDQKRGPHAHTLNLLLGVA